MICRDITKEKHAALCSSSPTKGPQYMDLGYPPSHNSHSWRHIFGMPHRAHSWCGTLPRHIREMYHRWMRRVKGHRPPKLKTPHRLEGTPEEKMGTKVPQKGATENSDGVGDRTKTQRLETTKWESPRPDSRHQISVPDHTCVKIGSSQANTATHPFVHVYIHFYK